jgi:TPR repeat protein
MIWRSLIAALLVIGLQSCTSEQGDANAQFNLGEKYRLGEGVPENYIEAVKWYRLAAQQGHMDAQNRLAWQYYIGRGVPTNFLKAYGWWSMAAAQGDEDASANKSLMLTNKMTPQQIAEAQAYATRCFENDYKGCD